MTLSPPAKNGYFQHEMAIHQHGMQGKQAGNSSISQERKVFIFQLSTFQLWCNVLFSGVGVTAKAFQ